MYMKLRVFFPVVYLQSDPWSSWFDYEDAEPEFIAF